MSITVRQRIPRYYECPTTVEVRQVDPAQGRPLSMYEDAVVRQVDRIAEATPVKSVTPTRKLGVSTIGAFARPEPSQPSESTTIIPSRSERHIFAAGLPATSPEVPRDGTGRVAPNVSHWSDALD